MRKLGFGIQILASAFLAMHMFPISWVSAVLAITIFMSLFVGWQFYKNIEAREEVLGLFTNIFWAALMLFVGIGFVNIQSHEFSMITCISGYTALCAAEAVLVIAAFMEGFPNIPIGFMIGSIIAMLGLALIAIPMQTYWTTMPDWVGQVGIYTMWITIITFIIGAVLEIMEVFKG